MPRNTIARTGWLTMIFFIEDRVPNSRRMVREFFAKVANCQKREPTINARIARDPRKIARRCWA